MQHRHQAGEVAVPSGGEEGGYDLAVIVVGGPGRWQPPLHTSAGAAGASWRAAAGDRSRIGATSSNGTPKTSCSR